MIIPAWHDLNTAVWPARACSVRAVPVAYVIDNFFEELRATLPVK